jgi:hypothetical protein
VGREGQQPQERREAQGSDGKLTDEDMNGLVDELRPEDIIEFSRGAKLSVLAKALMRKPSLLTIARHLL